MLCSAFGLTIPAQFYVSLFALAYLTNLPVHLALTVFPDPSLACNPYNSVLPFIHLDKMGLSRDEVVGPVVGGLKRLCTLGCSLGALKVCSANIRRTS